MLQFRTIRCKYGRFLAHAVAIAVVAVAVAGTPTVAMATSIIHRTVQEMTAVSALVIQGVVVDVKLNQKGRAGLPATSVTIAVDRVLKGFASAPTITISVPGGVRNGNVLRIPGMASFEPGEEVVVFLERTPAGWIPSGLAAGKYSLFTDEQGRRLAWRNAGSLNRVAVNRSVTRHATVESDLLTYDELIEMVNEGLTTDGADSTSAVVEGGAR